MVREDLIPTPTTRCLRIFAFDPSLAAQSETAGISEITIAVPWEGSLEPGPIGEYIEVVDVDPATGVCYRPIVLDDPRLLAQDGLPPTESNPQFHQQMVYAVAMATIVHFEQALGRVALWSSHREKDSLEQKFVRRLRIYPHALRTRNAYYSPEKKALLFGYFPAGARDIENPPGTTIFTCLSHDIVAHETTHALLDGVHPRFCEPMNEDVLAFHEAFADIVALFQHFAYPGVLRDQIARTRGNLASESLLGQLAQQFGKTSGRGEALRDALGSRDAQGVWQPRKPDPRALAGVHEPHDRGAILVAAVFGAFLTVYRARTADLFRIATDGTGVLRAGDIHPDLAGRLAEEAARCARSTLQMCIRAIDFCPPVGITFGAYLRGIVTADYDLNRDDLHGYRLAFVESFRQWGIHADGSRGISADALLWPTGAEAGEAEGVAIDIHGLFDHESLPGEKKKSSSLDRLRPWDLETDRYKTWKGMSNNAFLLWRWLVQGEGQKLAKAIGIVLEEGEAPRTVFRSKGRVAAEVHSVRSSLRRSPRGALVSDLVVEITQRRRGYFDAGRQMAFDGGAQPLDETCDFIYRAGCTLLIDPATMALRRVIRTQGTIADDQELDRLRSFLTGNELAPQNAFERALNPRNDLEPFALLHHHGEATR
jgi:hypothetical protein